MFDQFQPRLPITHLFINAPVQATPLQNPVNVFVDPLTGLADHTSPSKTKNRFASFTDLETFDDEINRVSRMIGLNYDETLYLY